MPTWSIPNASIMRNKWRIMPGNFSSTRTEIHAPTTPPDSTTSGVVGADEARVVAVLVPRLFQVGVGAEKRPRRNACDAFNGVLRAMGDVHDNTQRVHPPHHVRPESGQAAMHRRRGLDIAGFVHKIMSQLDTADAAGFHRVQAVQVALQKITALDRQHQGRIVMSKIVRFAGDAGTGLLETGEVAFHRLQTFAGVRVAEFFQPAGDTIAPDHRDVANGTHHGGGNPGGTHGSEHGAIHVARAVGPAGMGMHIDYHDSF